MMPADGSLQFKYYLGFLLLKDYVDFLQLIMNAHELRDEDEPENVNNHLDRKRALNDNELAAGVTVVYFLKLVSQFLFKCF